MDILQSYDRKNNIKYLVRSLETDLNWRLNVEDQVQFDGSYDDPVVDVGA